MKARLQPDQLAPAEVYDSLRAVVLYDDFDQPVLVAQKVERGQILVTRCTDAKFGEILKSLGIGLNSACKVTTHVS